MPRFAFKYETLLDHRRTIEEDRQRDVARLLRTKMIFEGELRKMQETIVTSKHALADGLVGAVDVRRIAEFAGYSSHVTVRGQNLVMKMAELENHLQTARGKLLDATKQRKALELLKEKQFDAWKYAENKKESAELDEIATQRYARKLVLGGAN
ncbi:flagellar export protein FliJ [Poriferisphaera sp. WC338]|uniref:flagellar export protein FliJ n=1 Tax=Poriferisphaera sp. WC338 TaxID=3425129 RepID=UPI003D81877D